MKYLWIRLSLTFFILCLLAGCVYGPKAEKKNPLNVLNGENYEHTESGQSDHLVVPIIKRKERLTRISGHAETKHGIIGVPVKQLALGLYTGGGQLVLETTTDLHGDFIFSGIIRNGFYKIQSLLGKVAVTHELEVRDYDIADVSLVIPTDH